MGKLSDREEQVIRRRYGIGNPSGPDPYAEHTMEAIGRDFHISREGIRQIEIKALKKLRPLLMSVQEEIEGISGGPAQTETVQTETVMETVHVEAIQTEPVTDRCHANGACADGGRIA